MLVITPNEKDKEASQENETPHNQLLLGTAVAGMINKARNINKYQTIATIYPVNALVKNTVKNSDQAIKTKQYK